MGHDQIVAPAPGLRRTMTDAARLGPTPHTDRRVHAGIQVYTLGSTGISSRRLPTLRHLHVWHPHRLP